MELSIRLGHPIHDCFYLVLSQRERCRVVTADDRLRRVAEAGGLGTLILWIGDLP